MSQGVVHCEYFVKLERLSLSLLKVVGIIVWGAVLAACFFIFKVKPAQAQPTYLAANYQVNQPTVWGVDGSPYIIQGQGVIQINSILTIEPGVVIKFRPDRFNLRYNGIKINLGGSLIALGLVDNKIVFTSWHDDNTGDDANEDENQTVPQLGDWLGLIFEGDDSELTNVEIKYAGANSTAAIDIGLASSVQLDNCLIQQNGGTGLLVNNGSSPVLKGLIIQDNQGVGLESWVSGSLVEISDSLIRGNKSGALRLKADNSLKFNGVIFQDNLPQRVEIISKTINHDAVWQYLEGLYYESFLPGQHVINQGFNLTIEPGVIFYLTKTAGWYVRGSLTALGEIGKRIIFTSAMDRPGSTASPGDWGGLYATPGSSINLANLSIKYGGLFQDDFNGVFYGFYSDYLLSATDAEVKLDRVNLVNSFNGGLQLSGNCSGVLQNSFVHNMPRGLEFNLASSFVVSRNDFYDLSVFALNNQSTTVAVEAINNWWGSDSGPKVLDNPDGQGGQIFGLVTYNPWLRKVPFNNQPELVYLGQPGYTQDGVEPNIAFRTLTDLDFKIIYKDADNQPPEFVKLIINDESYNLTVIDEGPVDYAAGYIFSVIKPAVDFVTGDYEYYFQASDGQVQVRWPTTTNLSFSVRNVPVVLVPGILGTELKKGDEVLWMNLRKVLFSASDSFMDPLLMDEDGAPVDSDIQVSDVLMKPFISYDYFQGLIESFELTGYEIEEDLFTFPYDWRLDININAGLLNNRLNNILSQTGSPKVNIIAHSMGGLVTKQAILLSQNKLVNKTVFLGTPHYGSPKAFKALMFGDSFGVPFNLLSPQQMKKLAKNMFSVYQLLPSQAYFNQAGSYYKSSSDYDYYQVKDLLAGLSFNNLALTATEEWHSSGLEEINLADYGVTAYNVVGCGRPTISQIIKLNFPGLLKNLLGDQQYALQLQDGDETVPLLSATGLTVSEDNVFYAPGVGHSKLPSNEAVRNLLTDIILENSTDNLPSGLSHQANVCGVNGKLVSVHSPVDIHLYNSSGQHVGLLTDGSFEQDISEIWFEEIEGNKFVFIPEGQVDYQIKLLGSANGSFDLRVSDIENSIAINTVYYDNVNIKLASQGNINNLFSLTEPLNLSVNNGEGDKLVESSSVLSGQQLGNYLPPVTAYSLSGVLNNQGQYQGQVDLSLSAADSLGGSGILKIAYSLDKGDNWLDYSGTLSFNNIGLNTVYYAALDKAGNWESPKQVEFSIVPVPAVVLGGSLGTGGFVYEQPLTNESIITQKNISYSGVDGLSVVTEKSLDRKDIRDNSINLQPQPKVQGVYKVKEIVKNDKKILKKVFINQNELIDSNDFSYNLIISKQFDNESNIKQESYNNLLNKILIFFLDFINYFVLRFKNLF